MGKIEGIEIRNYGPLKNVILGKTRTHQNAKALGNLVAIIGPKRKRKKYDSRCVWLYSRLSGNGSGISLRCW